MARVHPDDGGAVRQHLVDLGLEFLSEVLQLGAQAGLQPLARPNEFGTEGSEIGSAPLMPLDQRRCEESGPFLDQIPRMAVGNTGALRGSRDLARSPQLVEEFEQHLDRLGLAVPMKAPNGLDVDADHMS